MEKPKLRTSLRGISEPFKPLTLNTPYEAYVDQQNIQTVICCKERFRQSSLHVPQHSSTFTLLNVFFKNPMFNTFSICKKTVRCADQIFNGASTPTLLWVIYPGIAK